MTVNSFIDAAEAGMGAADHYYDRKRQKVQQAKEDDVWDRQRVIQDRQLALQDLELGLKSNDFGKFAKASSVLGLAVPTFGSENYQKNKATWDAYLNKKIPASSDDMASLMNDVFQSDIRKRENANPNYDYRVNRVVPAANGKGYQIELQVRDKKTGKVWNAPMTEGATVGQGTVQTLPFDKVIGRLEGYLKIGEVIHSDPEASKEFDQVLAMIRDERLKQRKGEFMQEQRYGFGIEQRPSPEKPDTRVINDQIVQEGAGSDGGYGVVFNGQTDPAMKPMVVNDQIVAPDGQGGYGVLGDFRDQPNPKDERTSEQKWIEDFTTAYNRPPTEVELDAKFGIERKDNKEDWAYTEAADGYKYYTEGPSKGQRVFPDVTAPEKASGSDSPYDALPYDKAIERSMATVQGLAVDDFGKLLSDFPAEDGRIATKLSGIASVYARENAVDGQIMPHTQAADFIGSQAADLTLNIEDAIAQIAEDTGIELSDKLKKKDPAKYQTIQQQLLAQARKVVDLNIEILQDRLKPSQGSSGSSQYSDLW